MKNKKLSVILNTYKLTLNNIIDKIGLDLYHTAIEFDGVEYAFGFLDLPVCGIYEIKPLSFEDGIFLESFVVGYCDKNEFYNLKENLKNEYIGNTYNVITKNCNHFTNDFCKKLLKKEIPKKFRFGLKIGEFIRKIFHN
jgi:hypothetical protein